MSIEAELLEIERGLWTNDAAFYRDNLIEDALLVFGETGVITRDFAIQAIQTETAEGRAWAEVELADIRMLQLTDAAALLTYTVAARAENEASPSSALASSVYVVRSGRWKLAFHQQTPVPLRRS